VRLAKEIPMSSIVETAAEIRAFRLEIPEEQLDDLRRRIDATRWPSKELVDDRSQGVQLANWVDRGGHFAAWEEPELFSTEVRAAFRGLRR
jgi:hypothetical protein